jgi:hypothetical protein
VPVIPALRRLSKENREANLGYIARLYLKKKITLLVILKCTAHHYLLQSSLGIIF